MAIAAIAAVAQFKIIIRRKRTGGHRIIMIFFLIAVLTCLVVKGRGD